MHPIGIVYHCSELCFIKHLPNSCIVFLLLENAIIVFLGEQPKTIRKCRGFLIENASSEITTLKHSCTKVQEVCKAIKLCFNKSMHAICIVQISQFVFLPHKMGVFKKLNLLTSFITD